VRARDRRHLGVSVQGSLIRLFWVLVVAACGTVDAPAPDVHYEPSPTEVVRAMLELAAVGPQDVVYDLGCGDGRIVIEAARRYGARGVCVEIDPQLLAEARANAAAEGVEPRIRFVQESVFETPLADASVVMLFLSRSVNLRLRPKLQRELAPGARIVSHWHRMGDWTPEKTVSVQVAAPRLHEIYLWRISRP
jgi:SAM-dependent methyltransferase